MRQIQRLDVSRPEMKRRVGGVLMAVVGGLLALSGPMEAHADVIFSDNFDGRTTVNPSADSARYYSHAAPSNTTGGARVSDGVLVIDTKFTSPSVKGGSVFISHDLFTDPELPVSFPFGPDLTRWQFNMQISRPPSSRIATDQTSPGFSGGLMLSSDSIFTTVLQNNGIAVLLMSDRLQLRSFVNGVARGSEIASILLTDIPSGGGTASSTDWFSVDVTYNAHDGAWQMKARDDGAAPADPALGDSAWSPLSSIISPRVAPGSHVGYYANYTAASMTMSFDNVTISTSPIPNPTVPEPTSLSLLAGAAATLISRRRR